MLAAVEKELDVTEITVGLVVHGRVRCGKLIVQQTKSGKPAKYEIGSTSGEPYLYCHDAVQAAVWLVRLLTDVNGLPREPVMIRSAEQQTAEHFQYMRRQLVYWGFIREERTDGS